MSDDSSVDNVVNFVGSRKTIFLGEGDYALVLRKMDGGKEGTQLFIPEAVRTDLIEAPEDAPLPPELILFSTVAESFHDEAIADAMEKAVVIYCNKINNEEAAIVL